MTHQKLPITDMNVKEHLCKLASSVFMRTTTTTTTTTKVLIIVTLH